MSDENLDDPDLLFPFKYNERVYYDEKINNDETLIKYDNLSFLWSVNFKTKPHFKKACLIGKYHINFEDLGLKLEITSRETNSLKILFIFKNMSDMALENFTFNKHRFSGIFLL